MATASPCGPLEPIVRGQRDKLQEGVYWTVMQNWDGKLWPRLWPNEKWAWRELERETGLARAQIKKRCDWTLVRVALTRV
jgi:hypothetical protein